MGVDVRLQDNSGVEIAFLGDPLGVIVRALPDPNDHRFPLASSIDWYGDTIFNQLQAELLRKEWAILIQNATNQETRVILQQVDELLQRCVFGEHLCVKFYGD